MSEAAVRPVELNESLARRWSPVAFSPRPVESEKLGSLFEAARWAPSSFNEQPWAFLVATKENPKEFDRLLGCLVEGNQVWAQGAPVLMLSVAKLRFDRNGQPNRHALHDVGAAAAYLTVQATALGLYVHQMAGFDGERARREFSIPEGWEPAAAIAVGYLGDDAGLPERLRGRGPGKRTRKALGEFVFAGRWGETLPVVSG